MNNDKPRVGELILKYCIERHGEDKLTFRVPKGTTKEEAVAVVSAHKPEILAELIRREEESAAKEAARIEEARAIRAGEIVIRPEWHDGEILSGWEVFGEAAKALEEIGAAKYINGWGLLRRGRHHQGPGQGVHPPPGGGVPPPGQGGEGGQGASRRGGAPGQVCRGPSDRPARGATLLDG